ncbi:MAG: Aspartyl/glutamyl-tRNA(Asn/Gln) amidotransferase subunit B [Chlamydiae bacterium]|nr:Aspartyl/glutamyl-tRNA(Asn/Gln) amidotransferase subunit B [Chlamydiota bacterium]
MSYGDWEPVVGLEIHAQLNTKSKLFSSAPNQFGAEPNTNITCVCTGQPGTLPILNKEAVKKAVQWGSAITAKIAKVSRFDRKSYFYPDSPRNFQITQFDHPIVLGGTVTCYVDGKEKTLTLDHTHLEDDAGTCKHFSDFGGVDYNRAGAPLIEIVSKPCIGVTPQEVTSYAKMIRAILHYIDASDCNMEEGSLRIDVNVSVKKKGEEQLRNKIEIKNMNSFNFIEMAIDAEVRRQIALYSKYPEKDQNELVPQATFRWDPEAKVTKIMRLKEGAEDYRYFPEPDIPSVVLTQEYIDEVGKGLPELPFKRTKRYTEELKLTLEQAVTLTQEKKLSDYFEEALEYCSNARSLCNWIIIEFQGRFKDSGMTLAESGIAPKNLAKLINLIDSKKITGKIAKSVADDMISSEGKDCELIVKENPDYQPVQDEKLIEQLVDQVLAENAQSVSDYKNGKQKAFGFLVGQVMKISRGKASPALVNDILKKKL